MALALTEEELKRLVALREGGMKLQELDNMIQFRKLYEFHKLHPTYKKEDLRSNGFKSVMVKDYWTMFVTPITTYQIYEWSDIMHHEEDSA